ncbi:DNA topoisomerase VI subunit B [Candidatus Woesearchaeota archaeon]|nr:DNA topoisomerase VI subunit B [Candidatus Woesearchaeota archaeon]MBW3014156.1 DNA topoisomerase VI subunit B [Candidatus Woesearchaeota archaeon]
MAQTKLAENGSRPIAEELAKKQREISVAEFFEKNRHLLGFDNKRKALLTTIKEAVDNALDACEEARVLPEINIEIIELAEDKFRVVIEDNGPGIVKKQVPNIFAKLLYGSKFHSMKQSRGQQGIGISAAAMYGQLTTGKPIRVTTRISKSKPAYYVELYLNTTTNKPEIKNEKDVDWNGREHGTRIEIDLEASYQKGAQSIDEYLKQTAIVNPHATIIYTNPKAEQIIFARATEELPPMPKEIKPHPYGIEVGIMIKMLQNTTAKTLQQFLTSEFSRVSSGIAKEICSKAVIAPNTKPKDLGPQHATRLMDAIKKTKIMAPPTDCTYPIGEDLLEKGLRKEIQAEFYCAITRKPSVYRGNPFVVECAIAYGGELSKEGSARVMRFANRVPLLYQQGACASTKAIVNTAWRNYGLSQSKNALPVGPIAVAIHIASVWAPFTSEAKEAIAHYPEIIKEMRLALQEAGRLLGRYVNKKRRVRDEIKKRSFIEKYIPHVASALGELLGLKKADENNIEEYLADILEHVRGEVEDVEFDPTKNVDYDEEFAKIGSEDVESDLIDEEVVDEEKKSKKAKKDKSKSKQTKLE